MTILDDINIKDLQHIYLDTNTSPAKIRQATGARPMTNQKYTPQDIDRAIKLNVAWQDHSPAELYVMAKDQAAMNRLAHWTFAICVIAGSAMIAALTMGWV